MRNGVLNGAIRVRMLDSALDQWRELGLMARPKLLNTFTDGKNHHAGLIDVLGDKQVIKVFVHSIDRALQAQRQAAEYGLAPNILARFKNSVLMEFFGDGPPEVEQIAEALSVLHSRPPASEDGLDLRLLYEQYLHKSDEQLRLKHQTLLPLLEEFVDDSTPWCFCHNDLVIENCVSKHSKAYFIDWEYAAQHNPWFDLAAIILYRRLNRDQSRVFLRTYAGWDSKVDDRIFLTSQVALLWADLLWHVDKYGLEYQSTHQSRFTQLNDLAHELNSLS